MPVSAADESATRLYNGQELVNIDTVWTDKQKYPYAFIYGTPGSTSSFYLTLCNTDSFYYDSANDYIVSNVDFSCVRYKIKTTDSAWSTATGSGNKTAGQGMSAPFWSSFSIPYPDGSIWMSGSSPIDPNAFTANLVIRSTHALDDSVSIVGSVTDISDTLVPVSYTWSLYTDDTLARTGAYDGDPSTGVTGFDIFSTIADLTPETEYDITYELTADGEPTGITASTSFTTLVGTGAGGDASDPDYSGQLGSIQQGIGNVQQSVDNVGTKLDGVQETLTETKEEITSLPQKIATSITEGVKGLFIPSQEDLLGIKDEYEDMLSEKLGFIWQAFDLLTTFVSDLQTNLESGEAYEFNFPGIKLPMQGEEFVLVAETPVSLENELMDVLRPVLGTIVSIICVTLFVNMAHDYVLAIVSGVSAYEFERRKE